MLKCFFVTGTDTAVGKAVVSRALLQALTSCGKRVSGYKAVMKGSQNSSNKGRLVAANPFFVCEEGCSMAQSYPVNYSRLSNKLASLSETFDHVVVEGTGGWCSLMSDLRPLSDWVVQEQLPVLMVVGIKEGCINHALLTAQAIVRDGLPLIGWVANRINPGLTHYAELINVLSKKLPAPLVGEVPYLPRAEQRDLGHYIRLSLLGSVLEADRILA